MREAPFASARSATFTTASAALRNATPSPATAAGDAAASGGTSRNSRTGSEHVLCPRPHPLHVQIEDARRIQSQDIALCLLGQERDRGDRARRVEIPVPPVGSAPQP